MGVILGATLWVKTTFVQKPKDRHHSEEKSQSWTHSNVLTTAKPALNSLPKLFVHLKKNKRSILIKYKFLWNISAAFKKHPHFSGNSKPDHHGSTELFTFESFSVKNVYVLELKICFMAFIFMGTLEKILLQGRTILTLVRFLFSEPSTFFSKRHFYMLFLMYFSSLLPLRPFPLTCLTLLENQYEQWGFVLLALLIGSLFWAVKQTSWRALWPDCSHKNAGFTVEASWKVIFRPEIYSSTLSTWAQPLLNDPVLWAGQAPMILI